MNSENGGDIINNSKVGRISNPGMIGPFQLDLKYNNSLRIQVEEEEKNAFTEQSNEMNESEDSNESKKQQSGNQILPGRQASNSQHDANSSPQSKKSRRESRLESNAISEGGIDLMNNNNSLIKYRQIKMSEIMMHYRPIYLVYLGFVVSLIVSLQLPFFGYIISKFIFTLQLNTDTQEFRSNKEMYSLMFLFLCVGIGIFTFFQRYAFSMGGENLIKNVRIKLFEELIYKHIGWFDYKSRSVGVLSSIFEEDI